MDDGIYYKVTRPKLVCYSVDRKGQRLPQSERHSCRAVKTVCEYDRKGSGKDELRQLLREIKDELKKN